MLLLGLHVFAFGLRHELEEPGQMVIRPRVGCVVWWRAVASGYLISSTQGIISNFETSTQNINRYLDVERPISNDALKQAGLRTIGFSNRDYLDNLQIIDENQAKFYQGMIKQKGTQNAIDRLGYIQPAGRAWRTY